jgi:hypothetical protein
MGMTISGTSGITYPDSTTQSTAFSTTYGAIGTYVFGFTLSTGQVAGNTYSGSAIFPGGIGENNTAAVTGDSTVVTTNYSGDGPTALSGTWRAMGQHNLNSGGAIRRFTLYVRIS